MAGLFDFIPFIDDVINIGKSVAGIVKAFDSPKVPGLGQVQKGAKFSQALIRAGLDPNDPRTRNLAAVFKEGLMANYLKGINDKERTYRRLRARGVVPGGIVPERRDEARTKAIAWGRANLGNVALKQAIETLLSGAGRQTEALGPLTEGAGFGFLANVNRAQNQLVGIEAGGDILQRLFGQFRQPQRQMNIIRSPEVVDAFRGFPGVTGG